MKRTICIFTLSLFIAMSASAQVAESVVAHGLKGKVKSLSRTGTLNYIQDGKSVSSVNEKDYLFDRNGKILEIHSSTSFNGVKNSMRGSEYVAVFIYNEKGLLASEINTNIGESKPFKVITYSYDDMGRETTQLHKTFYSSESTDMLYETVYSNKGYRTERVCLASGSDGSFKEREKWQYRYDDLGREIERYYYDYDAKVYWKDQSIVYEKTSTKHLEEYYYHTDGSIYTKTLNTYNDEGRLSATTSFRNGESLGVTNYTYTDRDVTGNYCKKIVAPVLGEGSSAITTYVITYY